MYIERFKDDKGDLFIKYPLINNLLNDRGWRTTPEANAQYARSVIGTAFALMHNPEESKYGDGHPFKKTEAADIKEEIDYAFNYAIGQNVDVTTESGRYKAASGEIPYFGIAKITDPDAKAALESNDKLLPTAVSAGIIHEEGPDKAISKYHIVHVAAVSRGAYGPRFVHLSKCNGDALSCLPKLKSAMSLEHYNRHLLNVSEGNLEQDPTIYSPVLWWAIQDDKTCGVCERLHGSVFDSIDANRHWPAHDHCRCELKEELGEQEMLGASWVSPKLKRKDKTKTKAASYYKERTNHCPVEVLSSLAQKSASSDINMSAVNNASTPGPQSFGSGTVSTSIPGQQSTTQPLKPKVRVRINKAPLESENPNGEQSQQEQPTGQEEGEGGQVPNNEGNQATVQSVQKELSQLRKQYESQANVWKQDRQKRELQDAIPKALFTDPKGRFRQKDWEKEIESRLQQGLPIDTIREIYQLRMQMLEVPEIAQKSKRASSLYYYNPVPIPKGASASTSAGASASSQDTDEDTERKMKLAELGKMVRGV